MSILIICLRWKIWYTVQNDTEGFMNKHIYVADDDYSIREALRVFLVNAGFEVTAFDQGDTLLQRFREQAADFVLLDVMMPPGPSGFNVCKELRTFSHVPIFILTARDSDLDYQTAMELGADDFFVKPVSTKLLVAKVKALFRRIEFERENYAREIAETAKTNEDEVKG